jgi:hypothetical protein
MHFDPQTFCPAAHVHAPSWQSWPDTEQSLDEQHSAEDRHCVPHDRDPDGHAHRPAEHDWPAIVQSEEVQQLVLAMHMASQSLWVPSQVQAPPAQIEPVPHEMPFAFGAKEVVLAEGWQLAQTLVGSSAPEL